MAITKKFLDDILEMNMHKNNEDEVTKESVEDKEVDESAWSEYTVASKMAETAGVPVHPSDAAAQVPDSLTENSDEDKKDAAEKESDDEDKESMSENNSADQDNKKIVESEDSDDSEDSDESEDDMTEATEADEDDEKIEESSEMSDEDKKDVEEATKALTDGEELTESFKEKVSAIFEASVTRSSKKKILAEKEKLQNVYANKLKMAEQELSESLVDKLDGYLNYVVEEWMKENQVAITSEIRSDLTENFIMGLKTLFESNFIDIPESKIDVLSEQANKIKSLEVELNEEIKRGVELKRQQNSLKKNAMVSDLCEGMSKNEALKFVELCEGVSFSDDVSFEKKLQVIKESYFPPVKADSTDISDTLLVEGGIFPSEESTPKTEVDAFADVITKMVNAKNGRK